MYFDFVFDQRATVWEIVRTITRCGRSIPVLSGSLVTIIMDTTKSVVTAIYNPDTIIANSLKWEVKLSAPDENDGVEVEYIDPTTWKAETVMCLLGGDSGDNPEKLKLNGCTSRTQAYREGMYIRASRKYQRENVSFRTGLEGHLATYGDLIGVSHDLPRWGQSGYVQSVTGLILELSEPVVFVAGTHVIGLRTKTGSVAGPYTVTAGVDAYHVVLGSALPDSFYFDGVHERPMFSFGPVATWTKQMVVVSVSPTNDSEVEIRCTPYNAALFANDAASPAALPSVLVPTAPIGLPAVTNLLVSNYPNTPSSISVSWTPALGATSYIIEYSYDTLTWSEVLTSTTAHIVLTNIKAQSISVRVAAMGSAGVGPYSVWTGTAPLSITNVSVDTGAVPAVPTSLATTSGFGVIWLSWINPGVDSNCDEIAVFVSSTTTKPSTPTAMVKPPQDFYVVSGLAADTTRYFWLESRSLGGYSSSAVGPTSGVSSPNIAASSLTGTITTTQIADESISTPKLAANSVTATKVGTNQIVASAANIADGIITAAKIGDAQINSAKIADAAISTAKIGDLNVTTLKIADNAVTVTVSAYTAGTFALDNWATVQTATITCSGAQVLITISFEVLQSLDGPVTYYRLTRNGTIIYTYPSSIVQVGTVLRIVTDSPGAGTIVYNLQAAAGVGTDSISERLLVVSESKK
jgi:predicted phage tail protein